jgi:hypothetical protein
VIIKSDCTDPELLSNFVTLTDQYSIIPITKFAKIQHVKTYLQVKFPELVIHSFIEKCDAEQILF